MKQSHPLTSCFLEPSCRQKELGLSMRVERLISRKGWLQMFSSWLLKVTLIPVTKKNWTPSLENLPSDICAQRRFRSACACVRAVRLEFSLDAFWIAMGAKFLYASSKDSGQTVRIRRPICVFTGGISQKVCFLTLRPIYTSNKLLDFFNHHFCS